MGTQTAIAMQAIQPYTRPRTRSRSGRLAIPMHLPLVLILTLQALEAAVLLHNTAFQDEALYISAGSELFHALTGGPPPSQNYALYLSGHPYLYPLLAGILNTLGGLEAVRWFSTACMLVVTLCVYLVTRRCFNHVSAYTAATLFAFQGPTLLLSRLATYDASCLALIAIATALAFQVSSARDPAGAVVLGPVLLLAVGVKYAALLFIPAVIGLMALRTLQERGWRRTLLHVVLTLAGMAIVGVPLLHMINHDFLAGTSLTTTQRIVPTRAPTSVILNVTLSLGGLLWLLGLLGLMLAGKRYRLLALCLVLASLLAPIYHLYSGELVSLQKHVDFGLFFIAPLAGNAVANMCSRTAPIRFDRRWVASLAAILIVLMMGVNESIWYYHSWPNSHGLMTVMRTQVRPVTGYYLCEDVEITRYYLANVTAPYQMVGLDFFEYTDANGHHYTGAAAYKAAIADHYFDVIELSSVHTTLDAELQAVLQANQGYELIAKIPYSNSYGSNYYSIWRKGAG